ncbi:hypothetical protein [Archangium sp.]|uniref:hypothetical protein n=1 Tax=Archangium sp. TaxID=1872627 RepID=UPI002D741607|nr:hypothetical protein [Archangium sp.]HYO54397.1 hypothetical protein [Archangium sp.]
MSTSAPLPPDAVEPVATQRVHAFVEAVGMGSPLGPFVQACAAFRAGLDRFQSARDFHYFAGEENARLALNVSALPGATFGFAAAGRLVAIACEMFQDLRDRLPEGALTRDTPLFLALPDPLALGMAVSPQLVRNEARRLESLGRRVLSITFENLGWTWPGGPWHFFGGGHVAFARALRAAGAWLARSSGRACMVAALDSLLDPQLLEILLNQQRLKTEDQPVGFTPGEAGVALLLRVPGRTPADSPRGRPLVEAVSLSSAALEAPEDGRALAACLRALLPFLPSGGGEPFWVSDHNGEEHRALEWGTLQVLLRAEPPHWESFEAWYPASGFGELGVASSAIGLGLAARALERGYAPGRTGIILSTDEGVEHAAVLLASTAT